MGILRRNRFGAALLALVSMLFMQLALASYLCPGTSSEIAAMTEAAMPCAHTMSLDADHAQPNLCQAHCQAGQQSADTYRLPPIINAYAVLAFFPSPAVVPVTRWEPLRQPNLQRATAPPLAVRNCCFRI